MGRQIAIVAEWSDELALLKHLAVDGEVRVFRKFGDSRASLWIDNWEEQAIADDNYGIWPTRFQWEPTATRLTEPCVAGAAGKWRFGNVATAPVIQLSRHMHGSGSAGRLYWPKRLLEPVRGQLSYDVEGFDRLVSGVWRWVRKQGVRDISMPGQPFVLPYASRRRTVKPERASELPRA